MDTIDKAAARVLGAEAYKALQAVAAKHGLTVERKGGRFDPTTGTFEPKFIFKTSGADANEFGLHAWKYGLNENQFGATFRYGTNDYKLVGFSQRSYKFPILAENLKDGKTYKLPARAVTVLAAASGEEG